MRDDETTTPRTVTHQVGEKLDDCSVDELDERILLLHAEITRLETLRSQKASARAKASMLFKP